MDKLDQLINKLKDAKEELQKNVNAAYGSEPNMVKEDKKVNENNPYGDEPKGTKGEDARNDKNDKEPELESPKNLKHKEQPSIKKEELCMSENGQWSLKKDAANPKLAPKDVKVKELQGKIDSGTYKPDAGKIADAIIKHPDKPLDKTDYENAPRGSEQKVGNTMHGHEVPKRYSSSITGKHHSVHVDTGSGDWILRHNKTNKVIASGPDVASSNHPTVKKLGAHKL